MANDDLTIQQVGAIPADSAQSQETNVKPKKAHYNIGAAMLAAENGGIGAGVEAGLERKFQLKNGPTYIDFKADGGFYTSGAKRANIYTGIKVEHNANDKYRPVVTDMGIEARYVQNNSKASLTTHGNNHEAYFETDNKSKNLQLNQKFGAEYSTKNNKFTLGAGIKAGVNIPLDDGFELKDSWTDKVTEDIITPNGTKTSTTVTNYNVEFKKTPEIDENIGVYMNADYKINKKLSLGLSGEYGNTNKEVRFGAKYNF